MTFHAAKLGFPPAICDSENIEECYSLYDDLSTASSIIPPSFSMYPSQTFDIDISTGISVFLGPTGHRLYIANLLRSVQSGKAESSLNSCKIDRLYDRLYHIRLDPPLSLEEAANVRRIEWSPSRQHILLVSDLSIRVVQLPFAQTTASPYRTRGNPRRSYGMQDDSSAAHVINEVSGSSKQELRPKKNQVCVIFADRSTQTIAVENRKLEADVKQLNYRDIVQDAQEIVNAKVSATKGDSYKVVSVSEDMYGEAASVREVGIGMRVIHVEWHPLSESHLVVLTEKEELLVCNANEDVSCIEQRHVLPYESDSSISFAFGKGTKLWDIFSCYILRSDGSIYVLCPLVPYGSIVSHSVMDTLRAEVNARLRVCKEQLEKNAQTADHKGSAFIALKAKVATLKSEKYWLSKGWAETFDSEKVLAVDESEAVKKFYRYANPHTSGISPETWPLAAQGPIVCSPQSQMEKSAREAALEKKVHSSANARSIHYITYAIAATYTTPFLVRSYNSGTMDLLLLDRAVRPSWKSSSQVVASKHSAILLDSFSTGMTLADEHMTIQADPSSQRLLYAFYSKGVCVMNVGWVYKLISGKKFSTLPTTSVRQILSVSPALEADSNIIGARVLRNVYIGHMLLIRFASGSIQIVNISAVAASEASNHPESAVAAAASQSPASWGTCIRAFADVLEEMTHNFPPRGTRIIGSTKLEIADDATVRFALDRVKVLYEDVEYLEHLDQAVKERLQLLEKVSQTLLEKESKAAQDIVNMREYFERLDEKTKKARAVQQDLQKRAAAVLETLSHNRPHLSRAEREYRNEIDELAFKVRRLKPRVSQLSTSAQRVIQELQTTALAAQSVTSATIHPAHSAFPNLSAEKKNMCYTVLKAETQLIDDSKFLLDGLREKLKKLTVA